MTMPFFSLYILGLGGSYIDIGLISAVGAIIRVFPMLIGGYLADTVGRWKIIYMMSYLLAVITLIKAFAPNYTFLLLASALDAIFSGLREPSFSSIVYDSTTSDSRALGFALWSVGPPLFGIISPYVIGIVMDRFGVVQAMRWAYFGVFILGSIAATLRYKYLKETLPQEKQKQLSRGSIREILFDFGATLKAIPKQLWIFLIIDLVFTMGWGLCEPYFVTYAKEGIGVTATQWGLIISLITVLSVFIKITSAQASDKGSRLRFIFVSMFMWPLSFFLYILTGNFLQVLLIRVVISVAGDIGDPAWGALFGDYSPKEYRGRFNAISHIAWSLVWGLSNLTGGFLYQNISPKSPFLLASLIMIVAAFVALIVLKEPEKREE
jgi:MFS family permease